VHHVMILGKWPTWRTILFYVFIFIFNSLHISSTLCSSSGETNCVNTTSGSCHSVSAAVSCAGRKWTALYRQVFNHRLSNRKSWTKLSSWRPSDGSQIPKI